MIDEKYSCNIVKTKYVNDNKITDHYAIIPTGQGYENYDKLGELQKNIYILIVKRFLSIFYPPAEFNKVSVKIKVGEEEFLASQKVCIKQGYQEILKNSVGAGQQKDDEKNVGVDVHIDTKNDFINTLKKGQELQILEINTKEAETTPPTRYNSGSIILAMENAGKLIENEELREQIKGAGIGTSATRGGIIEKLEKIKYIAINNKTQIITPTDKGEAIYDIVNGTMKDLLNPELTASWEKGLEMVAKREIMPEVFMDKLQDYIKSKFNKLVINM